MTCKCKVVFCVARCNRWYVDCYAQDKGTKHRNYLATKVHVLYISHFFRTLKWVVVWGGDMSANQLLGH